MSNKALQSTPFVEPAWLCLIHSLPIAAHLSFAHGFAAGMLKYGASLEAEPEGNCPYDTLPEDGKTGGDTVNSDANEML